MNINRFNINHTIVKNDKFNIDNVKCNITNKLIQQSFINIEYNTNILCIDGIYLETPTFSLFNKCISLDCNKHKYIFEIPLLENDIFNNIFLNIDKKINKIINNVNTTLLYENSVKDNIITIDKYEYEYKFIKAKLNTNECTITLDNKLYSGNLEELDYSKLQLKLTVCCYGLCKTETHFILSWKILKLDMKTIVLNLTNYKNILFKKISKKIIKNKEEIPDNEETVKKVYFVNNTTNDNNSTNVIEDFIVNQDDEHIYIPNFELELENIDS